MDLGVLIPQNLLADQKLPLDKEWQKKTRGAAKLNEVRWRCSSYPLAQCSMRCTAAIRSPRGNALAIEARQDSSQEQGLSLDGQRATLPVQLCLSHLGLSLDSLSFCDRIA